MQKPVSDNYHSKWQTHYTFYTVPDSKAIQIDKDEVSTVEDLLDQLEKQTHIPSDYINLAINNIKVFYPKQAKVSQMQIRKKDLCHVLRKPKFDYDKQKDEFNKTVEEGQRKTAARIQQKRDNPENKKLWMQIQNSSQKKVLYQKLIKRYNWQECLIALHDQGTNQQKVSNSLEEGKAELKVQERISKQERKYLNEFLNEPDQLQIRALTRKHPSQAIFIKVMRKLYLKHPKFRQIEPRHQKYVQTFFLGKPLDESEDDEPLIFEVQQRVIQVLRDVQERRKPKYLSSQLMAQFINRLKEKQNISEQITTQTLKRAGYNIELAQAMLKSSPNQIQDQNIILLKKSCRTNIILQLFNHPSLAKVKLLLKGQPDKATQYINNLIKAYKQHSNLVKMIKQCKEQIITLLSGVNCMKQKEEKIEHSNVNFQKRLTQDEQNKEKGLVNNKYDKKTAKIMIEKGIDQDLAISALRAAQNNIENTTQYLVLGGIPSQFDFCGANEKEEQLFIYKKWKKQKALLTRLNNKEEYVLWLGYLKQVRPLMYEMIIRNKNFFSKMIMDEYKKSSEQEISIK